MLQLFINLSLAVGLGFLWIRIMRPSKDDPRLSRGLQLLQSKIAILEDLSDRTDHQVKQLSLLLEEKTKEVQRKIEAAQNHLHEIDQSMLKSHEVAKIFQDKIPHDEIVNRQNTIKYVRAAQMAYKGSSLDEIMSVVDLPMSELEFIVKVNREKLMFSPEALPDWVKLEISTENTRPDPKIEKAYREAFEPPPVASLSLSKLGDEFRKAVAHSEVPMVSIEPSENKNISQEINKSENYTEDELAFDLFPSSAELVQETMQAASQQKTDNSKIIAGNKTDNVRPYAFPKIDLNGKPSRLG